MGTPRRPVAAHREFTGHDDDATALGAAPRPGQPETYASWRAAWRALGRPDADLDERELSDGQLRLRVRAYEREKPWAPRYVANELAATRQAAERHRGTATLRAAEATAADGPERARLEREAADAAALAAVLDGKAAQLELADQARARWLLHTAATRAEADRSSAELSARRAAIEDPEPEVTAEEWLAAHREAMLADEHELADEPAREPVAPPVEDVREVAAAEPPVADEDVVRVPTGDEAAESIRRAQRALSEIQAREDADAARQRDEQLVRWHVDDQVAEQHAAVDSDDRAPVMEIGGGR